MNNYIVTFGNNWIAQKANNKMELYKKFIDMNDVEVLTDDEFCNKCINEMSEEI